MCYRYTEHTAAAPGLFDGCVDACYILTMEGSPRTATAVQRWREHTPAARLFVQHNQGHRRCAKEPWVQKVSDDVTHAFLTAFRHALRQGFARILVFEDDYIPQPTVAADAPEVCRFVRDRDADLDVYNLGCVCLGVPVLGRGNEQHRKVHTACAGAHAAIYHRRYLEATATADRALLRVLDDTRMALPRFNTYTFHRPLYTQLWPATDNRATWDTPVVTMLIRAYQLDRSNRNFARAARDLNILFWAGMATVGIILVVGALVVLRRRSA